MAGRTVQVVMEEELWLKVKGMADLQRRSVSAMCRLLLESVVSDPSGTPISGATERLDTPQRDRMSVGTAIGTVLPSKVTSTSGGRASTSAPSVPAGSSSRSGSSDSHEHRWKLLRTFGPLKAPLERWRCEVCQLVEDRAGGS